MKKGFGDWIEIFKGGPQTDSTGEKHDGDHMIDLAVSTFNAATHEPPLVAGHPKNDDPAFGWVSELKSEEQNGIKTLFMKAKNVVPEFEELVKAGRYKKRSAAFYPDGSLRHVGFLGAMPPAVKGLADLNFNEGDPVSFEFYDHKTSVIGRIFSRIREHFIEKEGVEVADRIIPDWDVDFIKEEANRQDETETAEYSEQATKTQEDTVKTFTEADVKAAEQKAADKAKKATEAKFAENDRNRKIKEFCEKYFPENGKGKLPPALLDGGVKEFMEQLDSGKSVEFSEGNEQTSLDWFMGFLEGLPQAIKFEEVADRDSADLPDNEDAEDIARRAKEFQESEKTAGRVVSISDAVAQVTKSV